MCAPPLRSDRRTVGPWSSPWPVVQLVHEGMEEEMILGLPIQPSLVGTWLPSRVGTFRDILVVLALPCCTETERDSLSFLALEPSDGLGCGYVGLIVSSWLTPSRENCAATAGARAAREGHWEARGRPNGGERVCWPGWALERRPDWLTRPRVRSGCRTAWRFRWIALTSSSHVGWSC